MDTISFYQKCQLNLRGIRVIREMSSFIIPATVLLGLLMPVIPYTELYLSSLLVDEMLGECRGEKLFLYVMMILLIHLGIFVMKSLLSNYRNYKASNLWERGIFYVNKKILSMDYEYLEKDEVRNQRRDLGEIEHIQGGGGINYLFWRIEAVIGYGAILLVAVVFLCRVFLQGSSLITGNRLLSTICMVAVTAVLMAGSYFMIRNVRKAEEERYKLQNRDIPEHRKFQYYVNEYIIDSRSGKDIRIYGQQSIIMSTLQKLGAVFRETDREKAELEGKTQGSNNSINVLIGSVVYFYLGALALTGNISIGSIVLYAGCITQFVQYFYLFTSKVAELNTNSRYLKLFFDFLDIPNKKYEGTLPVEKRDDDRYELEFRDVSFRYPDSREYVLKHLSLRFRIGERLAVVGPNGSGKTTFIKLLCRLYDPTEGEILLNGINIKKYDYKEYMGLFSVVFQDFQLLSLPLGQNVAAASEYDRERVKKALNQAGMGERVSRLEKGLETWLYREGNNSGIEVSGGEAQKIGIARALYHDTPFIVLDEPTATLDPLSEYEIYAKFDELTGTKTAVYISHRLSSCRFCNDIIVFEKGTIVERGNHQELMGRENSLYSRLWNAQAQYYVN